MSGDEILRARAAEAKRSRRVPSGATCVVCGTERQLSLRDGQPRCYAHLTGDQPIIEIEHVAGRKNMPNAVVGMNSNWHRRVEELRREAGVYRYPQANGDPILLLAHLLARGATFGLALAEWLVEVWRVVTQRMGVDWWRAAPPFPFVP
jgi:hypothetical protein